MNATVQQPEQTDITSTIVLVHGAFADGSSWNGVLEVDGAHAIMVSQPQAVTDHILKAARAVVNA